MALFLGQAKGDTIGQCLKNCAPMLYAFYKQLQAEQNLDEDKSCLFQEKMSGDQRRGKTELDMQAQGHVCCCV